MLDAGLILLIASSRLLVITQRLSLSDLIIGLIVVEIDTSLPELASACGAVRKGENDTAQGSILSNLFNSHGIIGLTIFVAPPATKA